MTLDYPVVKEMVTTPNALDQLRLLGPEAENINSLLVVDDQDRLVGSLSIARLALARPTSLVGDIAEHDIISVTAETDQEECVRLMERYNLIQLPVIDQDGRLTGRNPGRRHGGRGGRGSNRGYVPHSQRCRGESHGPVAQLLAPEAALAIH